MTGRGNVVIVRPERSAEVGVRVVVVGGGISGLATAWHLRRCAQEAGRELELTLLEAAPRLGGTICTEEVGGFRIEWGPNGFLDSKPHTVDLAKQVGLGDRLLASDDAARRRFVLVDDELCELPASPKAFLRSSLLSFGGRLRVLREPWVGRGGQGDETVAGFARRRLGRQACERLVDPFVSGIFAGDPGKLSVRAAFPRLVELEEEYGSLIKASKALKRSGAGIQAAGPGGRLTSFPGGLSELVHAIGAELNSCVRLNAPVDDVRKAGDRWVVPVRDGDVIDGVDTVVMATPAFAAAKVLGRLDPDLATPLAHIPYAPVTVVALGYRRGDVAHGLDGFGFLIPSREQRPILGCLWSSTIFPGQRAPEDHVLVRVMVGGARRPEVALLPDEELLPLVEQQLHELIGAESSPVLERVIRHPSAIPQYEVGHLPRREALEKALQRWPGLVVTGNALYGVGLNDCTREAERVARQIIAGPAGS